MVAAGLSALSKEDKMLLSRRRFVTGSAALVAAPAILTRRAFAADPILVGSLHDQSGPIAASGVPMVVSLEVAIDEINGAGGLLGRPLKLVQYDTQSNIQLYSQYAHQLALKDKVAVVMGGITSASREAIRPTFDRYKVLYFYNTLYEGGVCDRDVFCTGTTPAQTVEKLVPYAMKKSGKKAYIIAADYNYGQITAKWMQKFVKDNGGETLSVDFFPLDVTNFGSTISKIQAAKPDTFGLVNEPSTLDAKESDGILGAYGYFEELTTDASKAYVAKMKAKMADVPYISELACCTYEGLHLWANAVKQAGALDRMKVTEALESGMSFDGPSGKVTIDKPTHHTIRNAFLAEVKDRKWSVLETFPDAKPQDTAAVCDLVKNPTEAKQYEIKL
jgi:branched-chain amino acid transport system substrate-binding protein